MHFLIPMYCSKLNSVYTRVLHFYPGLELKNYTSVYTRLGLYAIIYGSPLRSGCIARQNSAELSGSPCCCPSAERIVNLPNCRTGVRCMSHGRSCTAPAILSEFASNIVSRLNVLKAFLKSSLTMMQSFGRFLLRGSLLLLHLACRLQVVSKQSVP